MTQTIPFPDPGPETGAPFLDCERLDCFRVAVESRRSRLISFPFAVSEPFAISSTAPACRSS